MQPKSAPVTLTTLNDDCLLLICGQIPIREQFVLLQMGGRLRELVLHIWQRKYADEFDWQQEPQLKQLSVNEQSQLLGHMAGITRALLNLELLTWPAAKAKLVNMQRLSLTSCNPMLLRQLGGMCHSIVQLQLGACLAITPADLATLFRQLQQLQLFELRPVGGRNPNCLCCSESWNVAVLANMEYCQTLHSLKLPSCAVRATAVEIVQLPQLQLLTGFLCCSRDIDTAKGWQEAQQTAEVQEVQEVREVIGSAAGVATATISACLTALQVGACQIVALNLHCQLDGSLLRLLQGHVGVMQLQRFAWHSQLMVHYDANDGSIKWLPQQPQVARDLLHFIASQTGSLHELDFMRNVHATPTFLAQLSEQLSRKLQQPNQVSVWHDGCPRPQMSKHQRLTNGKCNDLPFVELELNHLANERTKG